MKLIPTIIQDSSTKRILMLGYMNKKSYEKTIISGRVWFYSRKRKRLWEKGKTSGNYLMVKNIRWDCDKDALLIKVNPLGPTCHKGTISCFDSAMQNLYEIVKERKKKMPKNSYTAFLFRKGLDRICEKISEEAQEIIKSAKKESKKRLIEEIVDLIYHLMVLLIEKNLSLEKIEQEILRRRSKN